jgi:hypothetical protein
MNPAQEAKQKFIEISFAYEVIDVCPFSDDNVIYSLVFIR